MTRAMCVHCGKRPANRPRGLCWAHYHTPAIRARYAMRAGGYGGQKGVNPASRPAPAYPTRHAPGTPGKVAAMAARVAVGEQLWHPLDGVPPCVSADDRLARFLGEMANRRAG